jgi:hypothetical protein
MRLALDIGLAGFSLRVEGIEVLFKTRVGGDAGVDGATNGGGHVASPAREGSLSLCDVRRAPTSRPRALGSPALFVLWSRAKKRRPFHRTPVMAQATAEGLA